MARALAAEAFLESAGYRRCDVPACNCNSWHEAKNGRAWQAEQDWRDTLLTEAFDALGHVSAKEWRELGVDYAKLRLQYERRIVVPSPPGTEE